MLSFSTVPLKIVLKSCAGHYQKRRFQSYFHFNVTMAVSWNIYNFGLHVFKSYRITIIPFVDWFLVNEGRKRELIFDKFRTNFKNWFIEPKNDRNFEIFWGLIAIFGDVLF